VVGYLKDKDNARVNRAGDALAAIGDLTVVPELAAALVTVHTVVVPKTQEEIFSEASGGGVYRPWRTVTRPDGTMTRVYNPLPPAGGSNVGGPLQTEKVFQVRCENTSVLAALETLTEQDFGYEQDKWLAWLRQHARERAAKLRDK
jgi:hypothetical protein